MEPQTDGIVEALTNSEPVTATSAKSVGPIGFGDVAKESERREAAKNRGKPKPLRLVEIGYEQRVLEPGERVEDEMLDVQLLPHEVLTRSKQMAIAVRAKDEREARLKAYVKLEREQIAEIAAEIARLTLAVDTECEPRLVKVAHLVDDIRGEVYKVRCDTGEELARRPLSATERQKVFPGFSEDDDIAARTEQLQIETEEKRARKPKARANGAAAGGVR